MKEVWAANAALWFHLEPVLDSVFEPVTDAILVAAGDFEPGARLLDIGCGSGSLLAATSSRGAAVVGVDISEPMIEAARRRVPEASALVADAEFDDLLAAAPGDPFAKVISRFGLMFFADPGAAFANIRRACSAGAALTIMCWRSFAENPMFTLGSDPLIKRLEQPPTPPEPGAPGPTAFAERDRLRSLLEGAGWDSVSIEPFDFVCDFSKRGGDGVEERLAFILGNEGGRRARAELEPRLGSAGWEEVVDEVRAELRGELDGGAVRFPGACWFVRARNPGP